MFSICSHQIPINMCSHQLFHVIPKCFASSQCMSQDIPNSITRWSLMTFHKLAKGNNSIILCWECKFLLESVQSFRIFLYAIRSDSLHNYIQIELWDAPPQICTRTKHNHNSTECTSTVLEVRTLSENGSYKLTDRYLTQDN
jgi:hypothetical protein